MSATLPLFMENVAVIECRCAAVMSSSFLHWLPGDEQRAALCPNEEEERKRWMKRLKWMRWMRWVCCSRAERRGEWWGGSGPCAGAGCSRSPVSAQCSCITAASARMPALKWLCCWKPIKPKCPRFTSRWGPSLRVVCHLSLDCASLARTVDVEMNCESLQMCEYTV